jgi:hypothetical protein
MKTLSMILTLSLFSFMGNAKEAKAQTATLMESPAGDWYEAQIGDAKWIFEYKDTTQYDAKTTLPLHGLNGQAVIRRQGGGSSTSSRAYSFKGYPFEKGVFLLQMQGLKEPLFVLLVSQGADLTKKAVLMALSCPHPLAETTFAFERPSEMEFQVNANGFVVSAPGKNRQTSKKTWTAPEDSSKLCHQKWQ